MSREEILLNSIANQEDPGEISAPLSRNEVILKAIIDGTSMSELPDPKSREEELLMDIGDMIESGGTPMENGDNIEF